MTPLPLSHVWWSLVLLVAGSACQSPRESRIQQHADAYAATDAFSQNLIKKGMVDLGFTEQQVFMAVGKPNRVSRTETPEGTVETWTYKNFLIGDSRLIQFGASSPRDRGPVRAGTNPTQAAGRNMAAVSRPGDPTIDDMVSPPLGTLHLELRGGRVSNAWIEP
jgi:hypothetical protein